VAPHANCPVCRTDLQLTNHGSFDSWVCPAGHGLAATLSELYERAQEDEIHTLWQLSKTAPAGDRACPMCERPMVKVTAPTDADEIDQGQPGDGPDTGEVPVDVCRADEVIWFDATELDSLPADLPDAQPTAEQEAALAQIAHTFGDQLEATWDAEDDDRANRLADRLTRSSGAFRMLGRLSQKAFARDLP
jgi:hypothetical protein